MLENVKVQDCMTHPAITVTAKMSVRLAQQIMHDYHIRHLPVVEDQRVIGILSSGDIRRARPSDATTLSVWEMQALWDTVTVEDVMSRRPITVQADTEMRDAVQLLYEHRFNSLPVVDEVGNLVGILTEVDVYLLLLRVSEATVNVPPLSLDYPVAALP